MLLLWSRPAAGGESCKHDSFLFIDSIMAKTYNGFVNKDGLVFGWHRRERNVS